MIWLWLQSLAVLTLAFAGGLWLGGAVSARMAKPTRQPIAPFVDDTLPADFPNYHGADVMASAPLEPEAAPQLVLPPAPQPIAADTAQLAFRTALRPAPRRWELLYPVNQFGMVSETRAPV